MIRPYWALIAFGLYLATGLYTVPANEKAVVRRFGRLVTPLAASGLHWDLPWPFVNVNRVNFNEIRTLSLGDLEADPNFLQPVAAARPPIYLTGDKNLLLLRLTVQYRVSEEHVADWLFGTESSTERLRLLVEATAADIVSRCGVDFVHTIGLTELNNQLLRKVREEAEHQKIGCEVEQVTIDRADPPARVKADFLEVSNARADMARSLHDARSYAEQSLSEAQSQARRITDDAERNRKSSMAAAQGSADRFDQLVAQIASDSLTSGRPYSESRQLVMNRFMLETLRDLLQKSKAKIVLDGERPFDVTLPK